MAAHITAEQAAQTQFSMLFTEILKARIGDNEQDNDDRCIACTQDRPIWDEDTKICKKCHTTIMNQVNRALEKKADVERKKTKDFSKFFKLSRKFENRRRAYQAAVSQAVAPQLERMSIDNNNNRS